jgi:hypothetical protein
LTIVKACPDPRSHYCDIRVTKDRETFMEAATCASSSHWLPWLRTSTAVLSSLVPIWGVLIHSGYCPNSVKGVPAIFYLAVGLGFDANASAQFAYNRRVFEPHLASP